VQDLRIAVPPRGCDTERNDCEEQDYPSHDPVDGDGARRLGLASDRAAHGRKKKLSEGGDLFIVHG